MKIASIKILVFDLPGNTGRFDLRQVEQGAWPRWVRVRSTSVQDTARVLHVFTDEDLEESMHSKGCPVYGHETG